MQDVSVLLFPLAETLSMDCSSTVMVQEVPGGEDRVPTVRLLAVVIPPLLVLLLLLVLVQGGELGSRWDLVEEGLVARSSPCCMRYNTYSTACSTERTYTCMCTMQCTYTRR